MGIKRYSEKGKRVGTKVDKEKETEMKKKGFH